MGPGWPSASGMTSRWFRARFESLLGSIISSSSKNSSSNGGRRCTLCRTGRQRVVCSQNDARLSAPPTLLPRVSQTLDRSRRSLVLARAGTLEPCGSSLSAFSAIPDLAYRTRPVPHATLSQGQPGGHPSPPGRSEGNMRDGEWGVDRKITTRALPTREIEQFQQRIGRRRFGNRKRGGYRCTGVARSTRYVARPGAYGNSLPFGRSER